MSDRYYALTVVLEGSIKDEDAEGLIKAIEHLRGVIEVVPLVADAAVFTAQAKARHEMREKLWTMFFRPKDES